MDVQAMMQQAKAMQERLQQQMAAMRVEGTAGGGMVTATVNGSKQLLALRIDPQVAKDDVEMLQDLVVAAVNDANRRVDDELGRSMSGLMGGLRIPGLF